MTTAVKTISQDASMSEAIKDMKKYGIHGLIVTDDKKPVGIVTTYDALLIMARGMRGETTFVKDAMSKELISISPDEDILDTLELMLDNQLTKLPVIDAGELVGILCATDLVDAFDKFLEENPIDVSEYPKVSLTVRDVMHEPTIIGPELLVLDAAKIMVEKEISSVLIKKDDTLGILTERDISKKVIAKGFDGKTLMVSEIMSSPCYTIESDASINDASELFNKHNIRRLPVVEHGEVVGMVSARDIAKTLTMRRRL
ncbi:MAG: CBS domain-containing protein, partial [Candidatus Altiarchaeota archaeon]|nr:CBS domain-containing protein [Candidatus Altiarchaeota archaeon]